MVKPTVYIAHSTSFDFKKELYLPLKESALFDRYNLIFPHESEDFKSSKELIKNSAMVLAEVSYASTGMGIELGWANSFNIPIVCIYKKNVQVSKSLEAISSKFIVYDSIENIDSEILDELI